jgi:ATP-binding cassette subfamily B protein
MRKGIKVQQRDITDCGAACIASVSAHYQLQLPVSRIRQYAGTDKFGTNVLGMIEAAERLGFQAKGAKGPLESLHKIPLPAIAHVIIKDDLHHFVVIYNITLKYITIMDPIDGAIHKKSISDFQKEWTGVIILLLPDEEFTTGNQKTSIIGRFWQLIRPHTGMMVQALIGALVYTILGLSSSIYMQKLIDFVLPEGNIRLLNLLSIGMILILIFQVFIGTFKTIIGLQTGQHIDAKLILGYYKHLLQLPQRFFDTMRVGEIISRVNDAVKIRMFINDVALSVVVNIMIVCFSILLMFFYYWKLALIMLSIVPIYLLLYWRLCI